MPTTTNRRGRPKPYSDRLFLKALVITVVEHLPKVHSLLAVLEEPEVQPVRAFLVETGSYPARRTFERRLKAIPEDKPAQIACLGQHLLLLIGPYRDSGRAAAIDSTVLSAQGGVWHRMPPSQWLCHPWLRPLCFWGRSRRPHRFCAEASNSVHGMLEDHPRNHCRLVT